MDGYLAQLEQQIHRVQAQLDELRDASADLLVTHRKKLADDKEKAFKDKKAEADKEAQEVAARIKKREDDRKAAIEQAKADAEKQLAEEFKAKTTDDIKAKMRAELLAKAKADADEEARVLAAGQAKAAAEADFKSRFGGDGPAQTTFGPPPGEKTTTFPTRPGVAPSPAFTPSQPPDVPRAPGEFDPRYGGPAPDDRASGR